MRNIIFICLLCIPLFLDAQLLKSPATFLDNSFGKEFTPHHRIQDYFEYLEEKSDLIKLVPYGTSYENRPLFTAFISSPANLNELENIRINHLKNCGRENVDYEEDLEKTIVWLSFGIHGNEAASPESAMLTIYQIINGADPLFRKGLDDMIIILDPCLNPDGHERYVNWYNSVAAKPANANHLAIEHHEPWPRGRSNHYLFDLNRDWVWGTQKETRERLTLYQDWMPHVHGDFHEMGPSESHYFLPAAKPYVEYISDFQRTIQEDIGRNIADHFDRNQWMYFTKEQFDLFYPGYGDTYPMLNGAIGMTFEMGGGSRAGSALIKSNGDSLNLMDRIQQQTVSAIATLEGVYKYQDKIRTNFHSYFNNSKEKGGLLIKWNSKSNAVSEFSSTLKLHNILYQYLVIEPIRSNGENLKNGRVENIMIEEGDIWIPFNQPQYHLIKTLMSRHLSLEDSSTYDITAWSMPLAYGFNTWELKDTPKFRRLNDEILKVDRPSSIVIPWNGLGSVKTMSYLLQNGASIRVAGDQVQLENNTIHAGDLIITAAENRELMQGIEEMVSHLWQENGKFYFTLKGSMADKGPDIGSSKHKLMTIPSIYLLVNKTVSPSSFGQVWHYFEEELEYPVHIVEGNKISSSVFDAADIIILPSGSYQDFDEAHLKKISAWVKDGGRLIIMGRANHVFADEEGFNIEMKVKEEEKDEEEEVNDTRYGERKLTRLEKAWPGAIVRVNIDDTHPFSRGIGFEYYSLKKNKRSFKPLDSGWNVGVLKKDFVVSGFAGPDAIEKVENTLILGHQESGQGDIIYLIDNPLFRGFWKNGQFLFANIIFQPL